MRTFFYIIIFAFSFIQLNAQLASRQMAVRKPVVLNTYTFNFTGAIQQFIVPNRVTSIQVNAIGAKGGTGAGGQVGGAGANITTTLNVTPGQILYIVVGGFPGQSATAKYGFGGNGGSGGNYGGAGGGLSGVFTSASPSNANALVVAGGGGGGAGISTEFNYTGGNAGNTIGGTSSNGNQPVEPAFVKNSKYQNGYAATTSEPGLAGEPYDPGTKGTNGNDITGGSGGSDTGVGTWNGGGGAGGGFFGGGGGAGGGAATGGGAGGSTKTISGHNSFGTMNTNGDGSVAITCLSNSGLVLHLDAGNTASYSGSGSTIWNDLSGNSSNVTLTSTSFDAANGGSIVFNGTSSYANFNANIGSTNAVTVELWVKTNTLENAMYFGFNKYDAFVNDGSIGFNTGNSDQFGMTSSRVKALGIEGAWKHLVFVMYAESKTNNKIYVNGESQALEQVLGTFSSANAVFNNGAGRISSWLNGLGWLVKMNLASFKLYNRELTSQEITNNFNTTSTRFYAEKDGLSPTTASSSAYQIKQDYPNSTDGFYWVKNANINGGVPIKIYADMTTEGGGWTLIMKNSSYGGWNLASAIDLNPLNPFSKNTDITSLITSNYSIIKWADYIKKSPSGFQYMIDSYQRNRYGGIWTANEAYSFVSTSNANTNITLDKNYGGWTYDTGNDGISARMPWHGYVGGNTGFYSLSSGSGNWWGTLIANNGYYSPAPWIGTLGGIAAEPGIIWFWVK